MACGSRCDEQVDARIEREALLEHDARPAAEAGHQLIDDEDRVAGSGVTAQDDQRSIGLERATGVGRELGVNVDLERPCDPRRRARR